MSAACTAHRREQEQQPAHPFRLRCVSGPLDVLVEASDEHSARAWLTAAMRRGTVDALRCTDGTWRIVNFARVITAEATTAPPHWDELPETA